MVKRLLLLTLLCIPAVTARAHPHQLLLTSLEFEFRGKQCTGITVDWGFDRFFSQSILGDFDLDGDGLFSRQETEEVYNYAFINLETYGFFLYLRKGNTRRQPDRVTDFSVRQEAGQVFYTFRVPVDGMNLSEDFSVSVFDPTYFCAVRYTDNPVSFRQAGGPEPEFELVKNRDYPVYYDPMGAVDETGAYDSWKPGLETAYPEEVHVFFR